MLKSALTPASLVDWNPNWYPRSKTKASFGPTLISVPTAEVDPRTRRIGDPRAQVGNRDDRVGGGEPRSRPSPGTKPDREAVSRARRSYSVADCVSRRSPSRRGGSAAKTRARRTASPARNRETAPPRRRTRCRSSGRSRRCWSRGFRSASSRTSRRAAPTARRLGRRSGAGGGRGRRPRPRARRVAAPARRASIPQRGRNHSVRRGA